MTVEDSFFVKDPGDLPDPGIEPQSPALQADSLPSEPPGKFIKRSSRNENMKEHIRLRS